MRHGDTQNRWPQSLLQELSDSLSRILHAKQTSPIRTVVISGSEPAEVASWLERNVEVEHVLTYYLATDDPEASNYVTLTSSYDPQALHAALSQKDLNDRESILIIHLVSETQALPMQWFESWTPFVNSTGMLVLAEHQEGHAAADWLLAAASIGLLPAKDGCFRQPSFPGVVKFSLLHLLQRSYYIRHPDSADLKALENLEQLCWPAPIAMPSAILSQRITAHPNEHLVLANEKQVEGVVYSQRIHSIDVLHQTQAKTVHENYDSEGRIVQLLALNVLPELQSQGLGGALLEFALQWLSLQDVDTVVGVTRWSHYSAHADLSPEQYLHGENKRGEPLDPVLQMHKKHGAEIKKLMPDYRPDDVDNKGYGVLVQYDLGARVSDQRELIPTKITEVQYIEQTIESAIVAMVHDDNQQLFTRNTPLMDLGFESLTLMELRDHLSKVFDEELPATFFFQYGNTQAVIDYFVEIKLHRYYKKEIS